MRHSGISSIFPIAAALAVSACSPAQESEAEETEAVDAVVEPAPQPSENYMPAEQVGDIPIERIGFEAGSSSTVVEDAIAGYASIDYVVKVAAGEPLAVHMETPNTAAYFNIIAPGETDVAFHVGSTSGNDYSGVAETSGDYRVRVYMMRSAARRDETAPYTLEISVGSD